MDELTIGILITGGMLVWVVFNWLRRRFGDGYRYTVTKNGHRAYRKQALEPRTVNALIERIERNNQDIAELENSGIPELQEEAEYLRKDSRKAEKEIGKRAVMINAVEGDWFKRITQGKDPYPSKEENKP
jgi:hypothetical protein